MCDFGISQTLNLYTHAPVFFISILLAYFVLMLDKKNPINRNLFFFILIFIFWVANDFFQWIIPYPKTSLLLGRIAIFESVSLIFFLFFAYAFTNVKLSMKQKILFSLPVVPIIALTFTNYNAYLTDQTRCDLHFGPLYWYLYVFLIAYAIWPVRVLFSYLKEKKTDEKIKKQISIMGGGILLGVLWFIIFIGLTEISVAGNYSWGDSIFMFTPIAMLLFIGCLVYAITKYQFLSAKLIIAQILTYAIWFLIGSMYFFADSSLNIALVTLTLLLAIWFGILLIKSVKIEIQQKEELEVVNKEINERKDQLQKVAYSLAVANDKLKQLDQAKTDFINIASHQLKHAPTPIKGYLSMLLEGSFGKVPDEQVGVLEKIDAANERQIHLVDDLLAVARMESGKVQLDFHKEHIEEICQGVYNNLAVTATEKNLAFEFKKPEQPLPELMLDKSKVFEAIFNFVDNAVKYTPNGSVALIAEIDQASHYKPLKGANDQKPEIEGPVVRVTVADTGNGISETNISHLFAKFARSDVAKANSDGTGLGLYVVKLMIEAHGGRTWAQSEGEGKGSQFIIEIPVEQPKELLEITK